MIVAAIQMDVKLGDVEVNLGRMEEMISQASHLKAELIVLPELCTSGYNFTSKDELKLTAEVIPSGKSTIHMAKIARENNVTIVFGLPEKDKEKIFNSAVIVGPSGYIGSYRKLHLFAREKLLFAQGDRPLAIYTLSTCRIGPLICFDWFFPETIRTLALMGADIICHSSNLVLPFAQQVMPAHSILNRVFSITANRIGTERGLQFTGKSQITNPKGVILTRAGEDTTEVITAKIDISEARNKQVTTLNHIFADRRPEMYKYLTRDLTFDQD